MLALDINPESQLQAGLPASGRLTVPRQRKPDPFLPGIAGLPLDMTAELNTSATQQRIEEEQAGDTTRAFWRDPALPFVESRRACLSRACYKPHYHPSFSIGAIDKGASVFTGAGEGPTLLSPGSLVFVPASRVHSCNPAPDTAWSYQMLHLDDAWLRAVRQEYTHPLEREPVRIVTEPRDYRRFCQLNKLLFSQADRNDKEAALIEYLGDYDAAQGYLIEKPILPSGLAAQIKPALDYLRTWLAHPVTLDKLAALSSMNRYQMIRAFRAVTGLTPHAWQLNQRINLARDWIRRGDSLAAVAQNLGFADQAHFQRVFKAHAGVTPGGFRA